MTILVTILIYFLALYLISYIIGRKGNSDSTFYKGDNKSPWYVVAFGMIGASISGVTFVSVPGLVQIIDMTYMQMVFGFFIGYIIVAEVLLPLYYKLNLTSIYSYIESRIGNQSYKTCSFFFLLSRMLGTATKLYLVCIILQRFVFEANDIYTPIWLIAFISVTIVWLYTYKTGIRTIVWTDALQTLCLVLALIAIIYMVMHQLDYNFIDAYKAIVKSPHSRMFIFNDWISTQNFFKQFFSGIFIVIVMTGLDQDMMQKNLSCKNIKEAKKNMYCYGFGFIPLNLLFLSLGILLVLYTQSIGIALPNHPDDTLPMLASNGYLGNIVTILFTIGIIAAAFSNSDSALTAMTTSCCIDLLKTSKENSDLAVKKRNKVHFILAIILIICICFVDFMNSSTVIEAIYTIASYTYGPLLGIFSFGLLTKRATRDQYTPYIAIASPIASFLLNNFLIETFQYKMGYELLICNGLLTFVGLYVLSFKLNKKQN